MHNEGLNLLVFHVCSVEAEVVSSSFVFALVPFLFHSPFVS